MGGGVRRQAPAAVMAAGQGHEVASPILPEPSASNSGMTMSATSSHESTTSPVTCIG
jgi:hypothetical protein